MGLKLSGLICLCLLPSAPSYSQTISAPAAALSAPVAPAAVGALPLGLPAGLGTSIGLAPLSPGLALPSVQTLDPAVRPVQTAAGLGQALQAPEPAPSPAQSLILPAQAAPGPKLWLPGQPLQDPEPLKAPAPDKTGSLSDARSATPAQPGQEASKDKAGDASAPQEARATKAGLESLSEKAKDSGSAGLPRDLASFFDGSGAAAGLTTVEATPPAIRRSLERTLADVRGLYARFFPGLDPDLPVNVRFEPGPTVDANLLHEDGHRTIRLRGPAAPGASDSRLGPTPFKDGEVLSGRIMRLVTAFHEYAHVIFYHRTGSKPDPSEQPTIFDAVNEGFAVMLELLMIDKAAAARRELGLTDREAAELLEWKRERLAMLRERRRATAHYVEGTLRVWHKLYRAGGLQAMVRAVDSLAAENLQGRPLFHPAFVLAGGEPQLLEAFLTRDHALRPGLKALFEHLVSAKPISAAGLPAVQNVLSLMRTSSIRRYFRNVLTQRNPALLSGPMRLAFLDARASKELSGMIQEELARQDPMETFSGTTWKDALRQLLPLLQAPMTTPGGPR